MATTPIGGASNPWGWVPPEWDTSGGVAPGQLEEPLVPIDDVVWPPPEWAAVPEAAPEQPILPPPDEGPVPDVALAQLGQPTDVDAPQLDEFDEAMLEMGPDDGLAPIDDALIEMGDDELAAPQPVKATRPKTPEQLEAERTQQLADLAVHDPEAFAVIQTQETLKRENERSTRELAESERQRQLLEENVSRRTTARAAAQAELAEISGRAKQMADGSPFAQWWSTRSGGQKFAGYLSAILGGFLAPQTGGRNSGLDFMTKLAEDDANQKWTSLRERKSIAMDSLGQADEDYRSREAFRLASYEQVARGLEAEMALLDPQGTARMRIAETLQGLRAKQAQAAAAIESEHYNRADKMIKADQDQQRIDIDAAKAQSEIDKRNAEIAKLNRAGMGGTSASKMKQDPLALAKRYGVDPRIVAGMGPMTEAEFSRVLENAGKAKTFNNPSEAEKDVRNLAVGGPRGALTVDGKPDGEVWLPPEKAADKLQSEMAAAMRLVDILDEVESIRNFSGGESAWLNSPEYGRLVTLREDGIITKKSGTEGMSSDEDMKKIAAAIGLNDLTSFRSQAAKLKQARINVVANLNASLKARTYPGPAVSFPNKFAGVRQSADDREFARLKAKQTGEKGQAIPTAAAVASPLGAIARVTESAVRGDNPDASLDEDDKSQIDSWAKGALAGDEKQRGRIAGLAADDTRGPAIRKYASGILAHVQAEELHKATGKKPGDPGFLKALRKHVGYTSEPDAPTDEEAD